MWNYKDSSSTASGSALMWLYLKINCHLSLSWRYAYRMTQIFYHCIYSRDACSLVSHVSENKNLKSNKEQTNNNNEGSGIKGLVKQPSSACTGHSPPQVQYHCVFLLNLSSGFTSMRKSSSPKLHAETSKKTARSNLKGLELCRGENL